MDYLSLLVVTASLIFLAWICHGFFKAFREALKTLGDIGTSIVVQHAEATEERKRFYSYAWTKAEVASMLERLQAEMAVRHTFGATLTEVVGPNKTAILQSLVTVANGSLSESDIRQRIAFLQRIIAKSPVNSSLDQFHMN